MNREETTVITSSVERAAMLIEQDIKNRDLPFGARYLTSSEVGLALGINERMACRSMALLADKGVLVRKRRAGTFVGPNAGQRSSTASKTMHVLMGPAAAMKGRMSPGVIVDALLPETVGFHVEIDLLDGHDENGGVERVLKAFREEESVGGVLLLSCSSETQLAIFESRLPAVVLGGVYQGSKGLSFVDMDHFESGRIACRYLLDRGHRRILFLNHNNWLSGDNLRLDGVNAALQEAGEGSGAMIMRCVHGDRSTIFSEVSSLLSDADRPTGLLCTCPFYADVAIAAAESLGLRVPEDIGAIVASRPISSGSERISRLPYTFTDADVCKAVHIAADMLKEHISRIAGPAKHVILPVKLVEPQESKQGS